MGISKRTGNEFLKKARGRRGTLPRIPWRKNPIAVPVYMKSAAENVVNFTILEMLQRFGRNKVVAILPDRMSQLTMQLANAIRSTIINKGYYATIAPLQPQYDRMPQLPQKMIAGLDKCDVWVYLGQAGTSRTRNTANLLTSEAKQRKKMLLAAGEVNEDFIKYRLGGNPMRMRYLTRVVHDLVKDVRIIRVKSKGYAGMRGTDLTIEINPQYTECKQETDIATPGEYTDLYGGEVYLSFLRSFKHNINGRIVVDGVVDIANTKSVRKTPLILIAKDGEIHSADCANQAIKNMFLKLITSKPGANKISELSLPTRVESKGRLKPREILTTAVHEKENLAVGIGDEPDREEIGLHIDATMRNVDVFIEDRQGRQLQIMSEGYYTKEVLNQLRRQFGIRM